MKYLCFWLSGIQNHIYSSADVIKNGRRVLAKYRGTSSYVSNIAKYQIQFEISNVDTIGNHTSSVSSNQNIHKRVFTNYSWFSSCFSHTHICHLTLFKSSQVKCIIFPTEVHDIIYNLYLVRFWMEGGQRSIAYRAVHLNTKTQIHEYCKLSIYHSRQLNDIENSTKRKKAKVH